MHIRHFEKYFTVNLKLDLFNTFQLHKRHKNYVGQGYMTKNSRNRIYSDYAFKFFNNEKNDFFFFIGRSNDRQDKERLREEKRIP